MTQHYRRSSLPRGVLVLPWTGCQKLPEFGVLLRPLGSVSVSLSSRVLAVNLPALIIASVLGPLYSSLIFCIPSYSPRLTIIYRFERFALPYTSRFSSFLDHNPYSTGIRAVFCTANLSFLDVFAF